MKNVEKVILFLDIDGVLHPDPATADQAFCQRALLWDFLIEAPQVSVVITSDWRLHHSLHELADFILAGSNQGLLDRFVGVTPFLPAMKYEYQGREMECLRWLADAGKQEEPWIAADDVPSNFVFGRPNVLITDYRTGLTAEDVAKLAILVRTAASA